MRFLFLHQDFPGQFKFLAPTLAAQGHEVVALTCKSLPENWHGVKTVRYHIALKHNPTQHPWLRLFDEQTQYGQAVLVQAQILRTQGYQPDVVIAHPSWGESLFIKDVWPTSKLLLYGEFYYQVAGADVNFDPEFSKNTTDMTQRIRYRNLNNELNFAQADAALSPTHWQAQTYPIQHQQKITVIHDGIDTEFVCPDADAQMMIQTTEGPLSLSRQDEIVTFVNRNFEPYRGYHIFMRSLPAILKQRPHARILLVGGQGVSYGTPPPDGQSWQQIFSEEIRPQLTDSDWQRIHFLGPLPYYHYLTVLQLSRVHVYLTYPFVVGWSLLEAMSAGCAVVASRTAPVTEIVRDGENGKLVDFFAVNEWAQTVCDLLASPTECARLGREARQHIQTHYDLETVCLPQQLAWLTGVSGQALA